MISSGATRATVDKIGRNIIGGTWPPGMQLPYEDELAEQLGIGRNSLREAVKVVSAKGMLRSARRYGTFVTERIQWNTLDPDVLTWRLSDPVSHVRFKREVAELRTMIEPGAAAAAALLATAEERHRILQLAQATAASDAREATSADVDLHLAIIDATHNSLLQGFRRSLDVLLRTLFEADHRLLSKAQRYDPNPAIHIALANAIAGGRAEEARYIALAITSRGGLSADVLEADPSAWTGRAARNKPCLTRTPNENC